MTSVSKTLQSALKFHQVDDLPRAEKLYRQILRIDPQQADALHLLGVAAFQQGRNDSALDLINQAIAVDGKAAPYHNNLGTVSRRLDKMDQATECFRTAIELSPDYADAHYNLGTLLKEQEELQQALGSFQETLRIDPNHAEAHNNLGTVLKDLGRIDAAVECYQRALELDPNNPEPHNNLGTALQEQENWDGAIQCHQRAISLSPDYAEAHFNLANTYRDQDRLNEASASYQQALQISPNHTDALCNYGLVQMDLGKTDDAISTFRHVLQNNPEHVESHINIGTALRLTENLDAGFAEYEWRWKSGEQRRYFTQTSWDGTSLVDGTLLVYAEQGVGDEIFFASCIGDVLKKAPNCLVECDPRLAALFSRSFPNAEVIPLKPNAKFGSTANLPPFDAQIPIGSLPRLFRKSLNSIPQRRSYLVPDTSLQEKWKERFAELGDGLKVGISWRGGKQEISRRRRSTTLDQWEAILSCPGVTFVNLQYGDCVEQMEEVYRTFGVRIHDWDDAEPLVDLDGFAAEISALDLVISIDNSTVHMAGALGVDVWTLLPFSPEWRWFLNRNDSPWYPSMRLFLQSQFGNWDDVFNAVAEALENPSKVRDSHALIQDDERTREQQGQVVLEMETDITNGKADAVRINFPHIDLDYALPARQRIVLLNDTYDWSHWGCTATSTAVRDQLSELAYEVIPIPFQFTLDFKNLPEYLTDFDDSAFLRTAWDQNRILFDAISESDIVVVNGEGSLHGLRRTSLALLYLMHASKIHFEKPVHLINQSTYPENRRSPVAGDAFQIYKHVYQNLDFIAFREQISHKLMGEAGIEGQLCFDCMPLTLEKFDLRNSPSNEKRLVIGGSATFDLKRIAELSQYMQAMHEHRFSVTVLVGANDHPAEDDRNLITALKQQPFSDWQLFTADSLEDWIRCLASASLLVSGRFHYTIAAAFLQIPCVVLESCTLKNQALAECFGLEAPLEYDDEHFSQELQARTERALANGTVDLSILETYRNRAMQNFDGLRSVVGNPP